MSNDKPAAERRERVEAREFISAWQTSESVSEVAEKTGLQEGSCQTRAAKYRTQGIQLKHMPRGGGSRLDIDDLNAFALSLVPQVEEEEADDEETADDDS